MEHLMNKGPLMIKRLAETMCEDDVREMIRYYFSRQLMDTSAENQMKVNIVFETDETFGLSTNDMLRITSVWQHPTEGIITFVLNDTYEMEFDDVDVDSLKKIMTDFNDLYIGEVD